MAQAWGQESRFGTTVYLNEAKTLHAATAGDLRLLRDKNRIWGLGPEVTLAIAAKKVVYGFVTARYQWEMGGKLTTEGAAWNLMATILMKPIHLP